MNRRGPGTVDPLADLRQDPAPGVSLALPEPLVLPVEPEVPEVAQAEPLDALWHQVATGRVMARWHDDETARSLLHGGGTCGCRYLVSLALTEAVGEPVELELVEPEDGDDDDA